MLLAREICKLRQSRHLVKVRALKQKGNDCSVGGVSGGRSGSGCCDGGAGYNIENIATKFKIQKFKIQKYLFTHDVVKRKYI